MKRTLGSIFVLILSALLYACNGGGGDGGNGIALPTVQVTITQLNAPLIAGAAFDTFNGGASMPVAAKSSAPAGGPLATPVTQTISRLIQSAAQQVISENSVVTKATSTSYCPYGGTLSVSTTGPASGIGTYSNCSMVAGETINGIVNIINIVSDATTVSFSTTVNLTITTVSPANTLRAIGDMSLSLDGYTGAMTMSGTSLSMGNSDVARGNFGLQNYLIVIDSTDTITTMMYTFASTTIGGTANFAMTTSFSHTNLASLFPSSGAAIITGANQTMLRLTVLGDENAVGNQVQLELSVDAGTTYASPAFYTWAAISSQI